MLNGESTSGGKSTPKGIENAGLRGDLRENSREKESRIKRPPLADPMRRREREVSALQNEKGRPGIMSKLSGGGERSWKHQNLDRRTRGTKKRRRRQSKGKGTTKATESGAEERFIPRTGWI